MDVDYTSHPIFPQHHIPPIPFIPQHPPTLCTFPVPHIHSQDCVCVTYRISLLDTRRSSNRLCRGMWPRRSTGWSDIHRRRCRSALRWSPAYTRKPSCSPPPRHTSRRCDKPSRSHSGCKFASLEIKIESIIFLKLEHAKYFVPGSCIWLRLTKGVVMKFTLNCRTSYIWNKIAKWSYWCVFSEGNTIEFNNGN